ncbi:MAG: class I SAM-dependent methyltransferase [Clostridia bacterium]|jgi:23S rRNA G2069 N7-methylase RlmK/C1962 C5-methylase RlmI
MPSGKDLEQQTVLLNRLAKRDRHLGKLARREDTDCYRVYDRDIPEIPLSVDRYGDAAVVYLYERPYEKPDQEENEWLALMKAAVAEALGLDPENVLCKTRRRLGLEEQYDRTADAKIFRTVREHGLLFKVNVSDYLDTGLFMDHRPTRVMVRGLAKDRRVLNLFCYTGSFSVYALAGGATQVCSVDLSNTYLAWADENIVLNGLDLARHRGVRADVVRFLSEAGIRGDRYDLIILDPPTFSNSKKMDGFMDVNRHWPALVQSCLSLLETGGDLLFSTNSRGLKFEPLLLEAAAVVDISAATTPEDFRHKPHRTWRIRKRE